MITTADAVGNDTTTKGHNMSSPATEVVGQALYLEFRHGSRHAFQMIVTPETYTASGRVACSVYTRQVNSAQKSKHWRPAVVPNAITSGPEIVDWITRAYSVISRGWRLHRSALVVDFTAEDADKIRSFATPYRLTNRIIKSRKALGWPQNFWGDDDIES